MTSDEISKLTIGEVEAIVSRATEALTKFREAQVLLGGGSADGQAPAVVAGLNRRPPTTKQAELTPDERAQRDLLLAANRHSPDDFPVDIAKVMGG